MHLRLVDFDFRVDRLDVFFVFRNTESSRFEKLAGFVNIYRIQVVFDVFGITHEWINVLGFFIYHREDFVFGSPGLDPVHVAFLWNFNVVIGNVFVVGSFFRREF